MTTLNLDSNQAKYQIRSYQPGRIQINDVILTNSVILTPDTLIEHWKPQVISELSAEDLTSIPELQIDILLIGTGSKLVFLPAAIYGALINKGIGVEVMDTGAACRTFTVLSAENRRVAAALIIN